MDKITTIDTALKWIRATFPGRCYVGGSYARHVCLGSQYEYDDIDIFITGPRMMEQWVMELVLNDLFETVDARPVPATSTNDLIESNQYFISTQFSRIVCIKDGVKFDLIFVDSSIDDIIINHTASSYSKFYYEISYHPTDMLRMVSNLAINTAVNDIIINKKCNIIRSLCSSSHYEKIIRLCEKHDVRLTRAPQVPQIPIVVPLDDETQPQLYASAIHSAFDN